MSCDDSEHEGKSFVAHIGVVERRLIRDWKPAVNNKIILVICQNKIRCLYYCIAVVTEKNESLKDSQGRGFSQTKRTYG